MNSRKNYSKIEIEIANISDIINNQQKGINIIINLLILQIIFKNS